MDNHEDDDDDHHEDEDDDHEGAGAAGGGGGGGLGHEIVVEDDDDEDDIDSDGGGGGGGVGGDFDDDEEEDDDHLAAVAAGPVEIEGGVVDAEEAGADPDGVPPADRQQEEGGEGGEGAAAPAAPREANSADITLHFQCPDTESGEDARYFRHQYPGHPVLRPGVAVNIGLGKSTKLSAVFARYVEICNDLYLKVHPDGPVVEMPDLEFVHCSVLSGGDTAEAAALMKGDSVTVRPNRDEDRRNDQERQRVQRESDKLFVDQMRGWVGRCHDLELAFSPECRSRGELVVLDCRPAPAEARSSESSTLLSDLSLPASEILGSAAAPAAAAASASSKKRRRGHHGQQQLLQQSPRQRKFQPHPPTQLLCFGPLVSRRCPWLGELIRKARLERDKKLQRHEPPEPRQIPPARPEGQPDVVLLDDEPRAPPGGAGQAADDVAVVRADGGGGEQALPPVPRGNVVQHNDSDEFWDAKMLDEDEDDGWHEPPKHPADAVVVTLRHPEDAVKLLLEYLYTNRAVDLGHDAFVTACRTRPTHTQGPVPPFNFGSSTSRRRWPNRGEPAVTYQTAVALVKLAFEAGLPRLALMAEVAASQLVTTANAVEALSFCHEARSELGRDLERLRKATMGLILRHGNVWVYPSFRHELKERRHVLVPTLISGTVEALVDAAAAAPPLASGSSHHHSGSAGKGHHHHASTVLQTQRYKKLQDQFVRYDSDEWRSGVFHRFRYLDRADKARRDDERKKRRLEMLRREGDAPVDSLHFAVAADASDGFDSDAAVLNAHPPPRRKSRRAAAAAAAAALDTHHGHASGKRVTFAAAGGGAGAAGGGRHRAGGGAGGERPSRRRHA